MSKLLFLDIDGVLNTPKSIQQGIHLIASKVALLERICAETDAKIFLTSAWRVHGCEEVGFALWTQGLKHGFGEGSRVVDEIYGRHTSRGKNIEEIVADVNPTRYVILDDGPNILDSQRPSFVLINWYKGLQPCNARKAISILNRK